MQVRESPWAPQDDTRFDSQCEPSRQDPPCKFPSDTEPPSGKVRNVRLTMFSNAVGVPTEKFGSDLGRAGEFNSRSGSDMSSTTA